MHSASYSISVEILAMQRSRKQTLLLYIFPVKASIVVTT